MWLLSEWGCFCRRVIVVGVRLFSECGLFGAEWLLSACGVSQSVVAFFVGFQSVGCLVQSGCCQSGCQSVVVGVSEGGVVVRVVVVVQSGCCQRVVVVGRVWLSEVGVWLLSECGCCRRVVCQRVCHASFAEWLLSECGCQPAIVVGVRLLSESGCCQSCERGCCRVWLCSLSE